VLKSEEKAPNLENADHKMGSNLKTLVFWYILEAWVINGAEVKRWIPKPVSYNNSTWFLTKAFCCHEPTQMFKAEQKAPNLENAHHKKGSKLKTMVF
jgi:hypothetical protein